MNTFSLHKIKGRGDIPFSPSDYSRFKYGSKSVARQFGKQLGRKLADHIISLQLAKDIQIVIASSPYMFIPTATFALKNYVISWLNPVLIKAGYKVVQETKVFRQTSYTEEYGTMDADKRKEMIGSESFHTDPLFIEDKFVLWLDDIKITGSHQERMEEMIARLGLNRYMIDCMFIYYAELEDPKSDPTIEDFLNMSSMKSLLDLDKIIKNDEFLFNTRNVKYILNSNHVDCVNFLEYQKRSTIESLYYETLGNSYHLEKKFEMNFKYLEYLINNKK